VSKQCYGLAQNERYILRKILIERKGCYIRNPHWTPGGIEFIPAPPVEISDEFNDGSDITESIEQYVQNSGMLDLLDHIGNVRVQKQTKEFDVNFTVTFSARLDSDLCREYDLDDEEDVQTFIEEGNWESIISRDEESVEVNTITDDGSAWVDLDV
jgi:hypothetical protein